MSLRDLKENRKTLLAFKGRQCFASLATNSIKIHIDKNQKNGRYIWIDPPWLFFQGLDTVTSSHEYSDRGFKKWCEKFAALRKTVFDDFKETADGDITFYFPDRYRLFVPSASSSDEEDDSWYDHWFASEKKYV